MPAQFAHRVGDIDMRIRSPLLALTITALAILSCLGQSSNEEESLVVFPTFTSTPSLYNPPTQEATSQPAEPTPAPPTEIPTQAPPPATPLPDDPIRIRFGPGAIASTVEGDLIPGGIDEYMLYALEGQTMFVYITSTGNDVYLSIVGVSDGQPLVRAASDAITWTGTLPGTQDYSIKAISGGGAESYILEIYILPLGTTEVDQPCGFRATRDMTAYYQPSEDAVVFGTMTTDAGAYAEARTPDGWLGFDPGVAQAGNVGLDRLRWVKAGAGDIVFDSPCEALEE
jgi:hypothetical protein